MNCDETKEYHFIRHYKQNNRCQKSRKRSDFYAKSQKKEDFWEKTKKNVKIVVA